MKVAEKRGYFLIVLPSERNGISESVDRVSEVVGKENVGGE